MSEKRERAGCGREIEVGWRERDYIETRACYKD